MKRTWRGCLGFALAFVSAAPAAAAQTRDSAGLRIVENARPVWTAGQEWRLSERPALVIGGGSAADERLGRVVGVTRLSDGRVVVADQTSRQLRYYDPSGRHLQSVSGTAPEPVSDGGGREPQFHAINRLPGDSIAVEAMGLAWILAPDGTHARVERFGPFAPGALEAPFVGALARFGDGRAVLADYPQGRKGPAGVRQWVDSASLFLADRGGAPRALGRAPVVTFVAGPDYASPMDLGPQGVYASSANSFYWGFNDEYAIRAYDAGWRLQRIVRRAWTPRPLTATDIDAYVDGWLKMWSKKTGAELEAERKGMREEAYPDELAAFSAILAARSGELWVREPDLTGAPGCWCLAGMSTVPSRWSVFDPEGRWLGEVAMPPRFLPSEIGADYVLGRSREADDVPRVVMYRIEKPR